MEVLGSDNGLNVNQFTQILPKIIGFYSSCLHGIKNKNIFKNDISVFKFLFTFKILL